MPEYKVLRVSQEEPRLWKGPHGDVYYIKVMLAEHGKAVSIGKKKPDALKAGDTVYGDIIDSDLPEDKFKAAPMQQQSFNQDNLSSNHQSTEDNIARAVALKAAVELVNVQGASNMNQELAVDAVLETSDKLLSWLQGTPTNTPIKQKSNVAQSPSEEEVGLDIVHTMPFEGEEINLDDIPF